MNYVLGLDIGIASVGWAVIDLETLQVIESCSNIFTAAEAENNKDKDVLKDITSPKYHREI